MKTLEGQGCGSRSSDPRCPRKRRRSCFVFPVAAAVGLTVLSCAGLADAFLVSPPVLAGAAVGRRGLEAATVSPRVVVRMVSATVGAGPSSATEDRGPSLGERLRADFPILDQVCVRPELYHVRPYGGKPAGVFVLSYFRQTAQSGITVSTHTLRRSSSFTGQSSLQVLVPVGVSPTK